MNTHPFTVSVIIPTHNRSELLLEAIASVQAQTFRDFELIVVDDGSTDNTESVVRVIADSRIRYHRNQWTGLPAVGRNTGIRMARGEYIAFLDSDDLWLPTKLERQLEVLTKEDPKGWCYCACDILIHETGEVLPGRRSFPDAETFHQNLLIENFIASPTPLVHRSMFEECGLLDERWELRFAEDREMWLRLAAHRLPCVYREPLARYRKHQYNATGMNDVTQTTSRRLHTLAAAVSASPDAYRPHVRKAIRSSCIPQIQQLTVQGETKSVKALCRQALSLTPMQPKTIMLALLSFFPNQFIRKGLALRRALRGG